MKRHIFLKTTVFAGLLLIGSACEDNFLDVNTDPNNAPTATVERVLPTALGYAAYSIGNQYQILGGIWSQYWTQGPTASQYEDLDRYLITSTDYARPWGDLYTGPLNDFKYIVEEGLKIKNDEALTEAARGRGSNYAAIGKIMQAYLFQLITDLYGDVPFSQALQGLPVDGDQLTPVYDSQESIYDGLITLADEGIALLDLETDQHPEGDDILFGGNMEEWLRFANTLKLKIYLRQSEVRPAVAQTGIQAMYNAGAIFLEAGEDADIAFYDIQFNRNPLFAVIKQLGTGNLIASNTSVNYLSANNDPRLDVFFVPASTGANAGSYVGINQGEGKILPNPATLNATNYALPAPAIGGAPPQDAESGTTAPVIFMSVAESYFLQAEAIARGWGSGDAQVLYEAGIGTSFAYWGIEDADTLAFYVAQPDIAYPAGGTVTEQVAAIITQKWTAMTGSQNAEAWTEWRRTGYPEFFVVSLNSAIGSNFPARILYPDTEVTRNPNTPPQQTVTTRLWWDVN